MGLPMNTHDANVKNDTSSEVFNWEASVSSWADESSSPTPVTQTSEPKVEVTTQDNGGTQDRRKNNQNQNQNQNRNNPNHHRQQNQKNRGSKNRNQNGTSRNNPNARRGGASPDDTKQVYRQKHDESLDEKQVQKIDFVKSTESTDLTHSKKEDTAEEQVIVAESESKFESESEAKAESSVVSTSDDPLECQIISQYKQHVYVPEAVQHWCQRRDSQCRDMERTVLTSSGATSMILNFTTPSNVTKNLPIRMWYDLSASEPESAQLASLLVQTHLTNQTNLLRLTQQKTKLAAVLAATKEDLLRKYCEEFVIPPEMLTCATGVDGSNISVIKDKTGVEHVSIDSTTALVRIQGTNALAVKQARRMLEYTSTCVAVTANEMQYLKSAFKLQEIRQLAKVVSIKEESDTQVEIMGLKTAVTAATLLLKTDLQYNEQFAHLQQEKNDIQLELAQLDPTGAAACSSGLDDIDDEEARLVERGEEKLKALEDGVETSIQFSKSSSFYGEDPEKTAQSNTGNNRRRNTNNQNNGNRGRNTNNQNNGTGNRRRNTNGQNNNGNRRNNSEDFYTKKGPSAQESGN